MKVKWWTGERGLCNASDTGFILLLWFIMLTHSLSSRPEGAPQPLQLPSGPSAGWSTVSVHRHHCYRLHHPLPKVPPEDEPPRVPSAAGSAHGKTHFSSQHRQVVKGSLTVIKGALQNFFFHIKVSLLYYSPEESAQPVTVDYTAYFTGWVHVTEFFMSAGSWSLKSDKNIPWWHHQGYLNSGGRFQVFYLKLV